MIETANPGKFEREKYDQIWSTVPEYKDYSPGLVNVSRFMSVLEPPVSKTSPMVSTKTLLDIGCGAGVAGLAFERAGFKVFYTDITDAGLDPAVPRNRFEMRPLWAPIEEPMLYPYDYGFCCDVLEHIPPEYTMLVIDRALTQCSVVWFQISNVPDSFGTRIGKPLHLTVQPFTWWRDRIATLGSLIEARDLCGDSLFVVGRP